ncbi:hypothetical protein GH714_007364 [Hevea brasiliensis]|uniref:THIF-type NAD/FAD binding fold domain-containing protein n=1 Tax=Hevea brasiliensis TaxID=3981 RepID=A0A6A6KA91_HEVBR|nr:hypothetical protein GH714_007364 [Hevea brasiliensis]
MESNGDDAARILAEIQTLKASKTDLDNRIAALEAQLRLFNLRHDTISSNGSCPSISNPDTGFGHGLSPDMITVTVVISCSLLLEFKVLFFMKQNTFMSTLQLQSVESLEVSILVVGAGGLGSPALLYLAACGVGRLGIVDHDVVELNNMHRQVIHTEVFIGQPKVKSAAAACRSINSSILVVEHQEALRTYNALEIFSQYDIIVDATDNAPSRYMISDCCVLLGKPLVSGAALGLEGQLTVYNYKGGPCYRCLFPTPPPTTACQRCADSGVLGVVPGIIGCLQALEAIKIASAVGEPLSGRMLLFDALSARIRIVKIRGRSLQCEVCGENLVFTQKQFRDFDYENFTQSPLATAPLKLNLLPADSRINSREFKEKLVKGEAHVLVDVRPAHHFKIVSLPMLEHPAIKFGG